MPPPRSPPPVTLEALLQGLSSTGARLGADAVAHLGQEVAGALAEAHATLDPEGISAPVLHLRLCPRGVLVGEDGEVWLAGGAGGAEVEEDDPAFAAPEQRERGRCTTRTDAYRLGLLFGMLLPAEERSAGLAAALATAAEPSPARRRITCLELQLWLAELGDAAAGRAALGALVRERREAEVEPAGSRPLSFAQAVAVALVTAAAVVAVGVYAMERG